MRNLHVADRVRRITEPMPIWRACSACHLVFCVRIPEGAEPVTVQHCPACGSGVLALLEKP